MPASDHPGPVPGLGAFMAADTPEGRLRLGKVTAWDGEVVHLQRPGGGTAWTAAPSELRRPTEDERALIRVLTTPVTAVPRVRQTCPEPPVVLSVDPVPPAVAGSGLRDVRARGRAGVALPPDARPFGCGGLPGRDPPSPARRTADGAPRERP